MLVCLLDAPHLDLLEQASGAEEVVPEEPILHLVMLKLELEMAILGNPPSPSWEGYLLVILIKITAP